MRLSKAAIVIMLSLLVAGFLMGCEGEIQDMDSNPGKPSDTNTNMEVKFEELVEFEEGMHRPDYDTLPQEIQKWVELSKELPLVQEKEFAGFRFVLITAGEKPTGGYSVVAREVVESDSALEVKVQFLEPGPDHVVTQALTYPYELIIVENKDLPVTFTDIEDEDKYFMSLVGIDEIDRPIIASSDWIKIFTPALNEEVEETINLSGLASVFEGTVSYELVTDTGEEVTAGFTTAVMGDWGYFEVEIEIPGDYSGTQLFLSVYSESMKDGSKMFEVNIPLTTQ